MGAAGVFIHARQTSVSVRRPSFQVRHHFIDCFTFHFQHAGNHCNINSYTSQCASHKHRSVRDDLACSNSRNVKIVKLKTIISAAASEANASVAYFWQTYCQIMKHKAMLLFRSKGGQAFNTITIYSTDTCGLLLKSYIRTHITERERYTEYKKYKKKIKK